MTDFEKAVKNMRAWQKRYFQYRMKADLEKAKSFEREVDRYLRAVDQPELPFGTCETTGR